MNIPVYHVDAFTNRLFSGNPAAVCILKTWLADSVLQTIAIENNLPVTAFLVNDDKNFSIRWFTPEYELDLCGHGTLSAGYIIFNKFNPTLHEVTLNSPSELLKLKRRDDWIEFDFAVKDIEPCAPLVLLNQGLGMEPKEVYHYKTERCLAIFSDEEQIKNLKPNMEILKQLDYRGIIVTAPGKTADFVSRVFYPRKLVPEDAVTGASHCLLAPYWAKRLNKKQFKSYQLSPRGGGLVCELVGDRVKISGNAIIYMEGNLIFPDGYLQ